MTQEISNNTLNLLISDHALYITNLVRHEAETMALQTTRRYVLMDGSDDSGGSGGRRVDRSALVFSPSWFGGSRQHRNDTIRKHNFSDEI